MLYTVKSISIGGVSGVKPTDTIKSRRSIRKYQAKPVPADVIEDILDSGRLAPTAMNLQPWILGAVTDKAALKKLADLADHGRFIADCAVCFTVFCDKGQKYYLEDGSAATMSIILSAWAHGVGTCWVAGDKKQYCEPVRQLLGVPEKYGLVALIPAGYPAESPEAKNKKQLGVISFRDAM
jgi:nitroreductase